MGAGLVTSCKEMKLVRSLTEHRTLCIQSQDGPKGFLNGGGLLK